MFCDCEAKLGLRIGRKGVNPHICAACVGKEKVLNSRYEFRNNSCVYSVGRS